MRANSVLGVIFSDSASDKIRRLTSMRTTGSVPFGGRYRFIDFMLSNMVNCGISKVGVITKSNYRSLMDHIGTGNPWDLSRKTDGLFLFPPFNRKEGDYTGKLEPLANISDFFRRSDEESVILCDSNILCNMDFSALVDAHEAKGADITICCKNGVYPSIADTMLPTVGADGRITRMTVPSVAPEGSGCYCVNIIVIRKSLLEAFINEARSEGAADFERDCIQSNVDKYNVYAYELTDYCAVIDSVQSYFSTSMALLQKDVRHSLFNRENPVYTKLSDEMPALYGMAPDVKNSIICDGCVIEGTVENSVLARNVRVEKGAVVTNSILMAGVYIAENARVDHTILDKGCVVTGGKTLAGADTYPVYIGKQIVI